MIPSKTQDTFSPPQYQVQSHRYTFYSHYDKDKVTGARPNWHRKLWLIGVYIRMVLLGIIVVVVGGIFPLLVGYEYFFKSLLGPTCTTCMTPDLEPYSVFNYMVASMLLVMGFIIPILVLAVFIHLIWNRSFRQDIFK